ncbi:glycosyltransferase family 2 protein [Pseudomonas sp. N040]|uniref:glycosyltransferase family 2 protein n=1 Tax=Pseudomonas sp. N040 TaxID=2785325 RepID=UPI0018A2E675|nr:glycosyltransferase [Pseudomonas sp. N040]MBF7730533.1 glycosyltransferase [Pseudomonas sp. N040]MBW7014177.1 glycosyltransferase [Pseudomonas sp. N040]
MISATKLAIAIPTFNRAQIMEENLCLMRPALERLDIPLYIFDDSTDDETETLVHRISATTGLRIFYTRNSPALGHDRNLLSALLLSGYEHVWLLGDSMYIDEVALDLVYRGLCGQDFVFVNGRDDLDFPEVRALSGGELKDFMADCTWSLTMTGATIYGRRVIDWLSANSLPVIYKNFPQLSVILSYIENHPDASVLWIGQRVIYSNKNKISYWSARAVEVFGRDWFEVISAHQAVFGISTMSAVLQSHARNTGILNYKHLIYLRSKGYFSNAILQCNMDRLYPCTTTARIVVWLVANMPLKLAGKLLALKQAVLKFNSNWKGRT